MKRDASIRYNVLASTRRECSNAKFVNSTSRPSLSVVWCEEEGGIVVEDGCGCILEVEGSTASGSDVSDLSTASANLAT